MSAKPCPVCTNPMVEQDRDGVIVDECEHGLWLDQTELYKLTESHRHRISKGILKGILRTRKKPKKHESRALVCPLGGDVMQTTSFRKVQIDWCHTHGVWLDAGELEAILHNIEVDKSYLRSIMERLEDSRY